MSSQTPAKPSLCQLSESGATSTWSAFVLMLQNNSKLQQYALNQQQAEAAAQGAAGQAQATAQVNAGNAAQAIAILNGTGSIVNGIVSLGTTAVAAKTTSSLDEQATALDDEAKINSAPLEPIDARNARDPVALAEREAETTRRSALAKSARKQASELRSQSSNKMQTYSMAGQHAGTAVQGMFGIGTQGYEQDKGQAEATAALTSTSSQLDSTANNAAVTAQQQAASRNDHLSQDRDAFTRALQV